MDVASDESNKCRSGTVLSHLGLQSTISFSHPVRQQVGQPPANQHICIRVNLLKNTKDLQLSQTAGWPKYIWITVDLFKNTKEAQLSQTQSLKLHILRRKLAHFWCKKWRSMSGIGSDLLKTHKTYNYPRHGVSNLRPEFPQIPGPNCVTKLAPRSSDW